MLKGARMAQREQKQLSLADGLVARRSGQNERLERIDAIVDWGPLEERLSVIYASKAGRPSYRVLCLFKCLLLQQWYVLSDVELEEALADRLSFRRFVGLALDEAVPDHSTLSRFRKQLARHDLSAVLFEEMNRQFDARGLIVRQGTLIDATLVSAQAARPSASSHTRTSAVDPQADWTRRGNKYYFGYKAHVAVDQGSGLIRRALLSPASVNDTVPADDLILGDEAAVYADMAYDTRARRQALRGAGIKDRIMHRGHKHGPLPPWRARRNHLIQPIRAAVEGVFGLMKRSYGYHKVRYHGLSANATHLDLLCIAINLRRAEALLR